MANILIFGDSIVQGFFDIEGGWANRINQFCIKESIESDFQRINDVFNLGKSGDTTVELLQRIESETKNRVWDNNSTIIIVAIGINDSEIVTQTNKNLVSPEEFEINIGKIHQITSRYAKNIIFTGLTPIDEEKVNPIPWFFERAYLDKEVKKYDTIIKNYCQISNLSYIYLQDKLKSKHLIDGVHPNPEGHKIIFRTVRNYLLQKKYI